MKKPYKPNEKFLDAKAGFEEINFDREVGVDLRKNIAIKFDVM